jgi:hypothetical protein
MWNGVRWRLLHARLPRKAVHWARQPAIGALFSISCPRPDRCIAVGGFARGTGTHDGVFADLWNGHRWFLMP